MTNNIKQQENKGILSVIAAGICWGILGLFVHFADAAGLSAMQIGFLRVSIATLFLFILLFIKDPRLFRIHPKDLWMFIGTGVLSLTLFSFCYYRVVEESEVSVAVVLLYTSPIFVMLMSAVIFHETITIRKLTALVMTFIGCILVAGFLGGPTLTLQVLLLGICSGLFYGLYSIFGKFAVRKYRSETITFYTFLFSAAAFLPFSEPANLITKITPQVLLICVLMAFFSTVLPYLFYTYGLSQMDSGKAAIFVTVEPMVGAITGMLFLHEDHNPLKILGIILILGASVVLARPQIGRIKT